MCVKYWKSISSCDCWVWAMTDWSGWDRAWGHLGLRRFFSWFCWSIRMIYQSQQSWQLFKLETQTLKNIFLFFFKILKNVVASIIRKSPIKQCLKQLVLAPTSNQMSNENYFVAPSDNVESYKSISSELYLQRPPLPRPQNSNCNLWWLCTPWGGWIYFSLVE